MKRVMAFDIYLKARGPCPVSAAEAMITPEEAALARVPVPTIYAGIEAEGIHFLETPDGLLLLCANSLFQRNGLVNWKNSLGRRIQGRILKRKRS